jgi:hypothetical protein
MTVDATQHGPPIPHPACEVNICVEKLEYPLQLVDRIFHCKSSTSQERVTSRVRKIANDIKGEKRCAVLDVQGMQQYKRATSAKGWW